MYRSALLALWRVNKWKRMEEEGDSDEDTDNDDPTGIFRACAAALVRQRKEAEAAAREVSTWM